MSSELNANFSSYDKVKLKEYIKQGIIDFICISNANDKEGKNKNTEKQEFNEIFIKYNTKNEEWNMYEMDSNIEEVSFIAEVIKSLSPPDYGKYTKDIFPEIEDEIIFTLKLDNLAEFLLSIRNINVPLTDEEKFKEIKVCLKKYINLDLEKLKISLFDSYKVYLDILLSVIPYYSEMNL